MNNTILIALLSFIHCSGYGQLNYRGIVIEKGYEFLNGGVREMRINLISGNDTSIDLTDEKGNFYFQIDQTKDIHLVGRRRDFKILDTIVKPHVPQNTAPNTRQIIDTFRLESTFDKTRKINFSYNAQVASLNIRDKNLYLLLPTGLAGSDVDDSDTTFELKYNIRYIHRGCLRTKFDDDRGYNKAIFDYLDKTYGVEWRKEVRPDAIGFTR